MSYHAPRKRLIEEFLDYNHSPYLDFTTKLNECRQMLIILANFSGDKLHVELASCANNMLRLGIAAELESRKKQEAINEE